MTAIGILGAGQLGRMLALAGYPLGLRFRFLDPAPDAPAGQLAEQIVGDYTDPRAQRAFAAGLDVITYEFENVPLAAAQALSAYAPVYPPPAALAAAQDRLAEKTLFTRLGLPTPRFIALDTYAGLQAAIQQIGLPAVLKTRRLGYDGKGQAVLRQPSDLAAAWAALGGAELILESWAPFERELSLLAARGRAGQVVCYPLVENRHRQGLLRLSLAPAPALDPAMQRQAEEYARRVLTELDYVGLLAIEWFQVGGQLLANEMAPRVHNSGHWTIEGARTSQFANHLRAILGWPLGDPAARGACAMFNLIGSAPPLADLLAIPNAQVHLYGKTPRPGRKLGHVTLCGDSPAEIAEWLEPASGQAAGWLRQLGFLGEE